MEHHISEIDVLDRVLEKGIVIDSHARLFVLGVDVLTTIDSRVVVASIDTYLKIAETHGKNHLNDPTCGTSRPRPRRRARKG